MAKSPVAKKSAPKKGTAGAKKVVAGNESPFTKKPAPPKKAVAAKRPASPRKSGRPKDNPPLEWIQGPLVQDSNGVVGLQTAQGFISLQHAAEEGQLVGLFFPLAATGSGDLYTMIDKLMAFIRTHAAGSIMGGVTCCGN